MDNREYEIDGLVFTVVEHTSWFNDETEIDGYSVHLRPPARGVMRPGELWDGGTEPLMNLGEPLDRWSPRCDALTLRRALRPSGLVRWTDEHEAEWVCRFVQRKLDGR